MKWTNDATKAIYEMFFDGFNYTWTFDEEIANTLYMHVWEVLKSDQNQKVNRTYRLAVMFLDQADFFQIADVLNTGVTEFRKPEFKKPVSVSHLKVFAE